MKILRNLPWIRILKAIFMALKNTGTSQSDIFDLVLFLLISGTEVEGTNMTTILGNKCSLCIMDCIFYWT